MSDIFISRRGAVLSGLAAAGALAACAPGRPKGAAPPKTLEAAVAGSWRAPADKARDVYRHPLQSLQFWGLKPGQTVVEFWPGAGWYTDIVAPYLAATGGKFYAADLQAPDAEGRTLDEAYRHKLAASPGLYGKVNLTAFGATSGPVAPAGTADLVLFLRNLHNWMAAGLAEKAFRDAFAALKPGGVLGVEEHRADPAAVPDVLAQSGYVAQAYVVKLGQEAGFQLAAASEINANPKDDHNHPFGVWTLPPVRRSSAPGQPPDPGFDRAKYDAVGESDRMTLKFVKPGSQNG
ncbi:methyltransferase [Phenylobacterium sp.]|uniref:class I SAM-dependent methyltransferase n=1 Tax=Phenylobacterium sp. TaxID=1871053 RepID=UPI00120CC33E|nr:methyltransferase [Phenylobacterium sp.]THD64679.1 MAG: methyltransferase [Phenylobacterium sp.]